MKAFVTDDHERDLLDFFIGTALGGLCANPETGRDMMQAQILHQQSPTELIGQAAVAMAIGAMKARKAYLAANQEKHQGQGRPATNGGNDGDVRPGSEQLADPPPGPGGANG